MRTAAISVAILFMTGFFGCGAASADPSWTPPVLNNDMQRFLSTQSEWYLTPIGVPGSVEWELPRSSPPETAWTTLRDAACDLAENYLPLAGEKAAGKLLARWVIAQKLLKPAVGKATEISVHKYCTEAADRLPALLHWFMD